MAKLKAPLMSLGASGAIGKALVFFGWKGLDVVREYVVPANPKTAAQVVQRGYLKDAVDAIHSSQAHATHPLVAVDITAYALLGSIFKTPRTWFNTIVKQWLDMKIAGKTPGVYRWSNVDPGDTVIEFRSEFAESANNMTDGKMYWGTSKTALVNSAVWTAAELLAAKNITGLTNGVKYYFQFRADTPVEFIGANTGIFHATPHA